MASFFEFVFTNFIAITVIVLTAFGTFRKGKFDFLAVWSSVLIVLPMYYWFKTTDSYSEGFVQIILPLWPIWLLGLLFGGISASHGHRIRNNYQLTRDALAANILDDLKAGKNRGFYLYLRPFLADRKYRFGAGKNHLGLGQPLVYLSVDEAIVADNRAARRTVGIVRKKSHRSKGIGNIYCPEEADWKCDVTLLIEKSSLILIVPDIYEGVSWELQKIVSLDALGKTIFVIPNGMSRLNRNRVTECIESIVGKKIHSLPAIFCVDEGKRILKYSTISAAIEKSLDDNRNAPVI